VCSTAQLSGDVIDVCGTTTGTVVVTARIHQQQALHSQASALVHIVKFTAVRLRSLRPEVLQGSKHQLEAELLHHQHVLSGAHLLAFDWSASGNEGHSIYSVFDEALV
jgi:hypothetical protein